MKHFKHIAKRTSLFLFACGLATTASAQILRTAFSQDVPYSLQLNPAQMPTHGYISPLLGPLSVTATSNAFSTGNVQDMFDKNSDYFKSNKFLNDLKDENNLNLSLGWDQIGAGWFAGKNFWSFSIGTRMEMGATMPKSVFNLMNEANGADVNWNNNGKGRLWDLDGEKLNIQIYQEIGIGFARQITDKLTIGGKVKVLAGLANVDFEIEKMEINTPAVKVEEVQKMADEWENLQLDWSNFTTQSYMQAKELVEMRKQIKGQAGIELKGTLKSSMGGLKWKKEDDKDYISGVEMNGFGISGYGLGLDLGATYKVLDNLTVSAAVLDLGFISWNKDKAQKIEIGTSGKTNYNLSYGNGSTDQSTLTVANYDPNKEHDLFDFAKKISSNEIVNFDMLEMNETEGEAYTTSLYTTITLGGEYTLLDDKLVLSALYSGRFTKPKALHELTLAGAYNLSTWANIALSYSMIQSAGKSFGLGVKLGPVYVGTDYMFFGNDTKCVNALLGLSLPLGKQKKS